MFPLLALPFPLPVVPHAGVASPRVSSVREAPVESPSVLQDKRDERALVVVSEGSPIAERILCRSSWSSRHRLGALRLIRPWPWLRVPSKLALESDLRRLPTDAVALLVVTSANHLGLSGPPDRASLAQLPEVSAPSFAPRFLAAPMSSLIAGTVPTRISLNSLQLADRLGCPVAGHAAGKAGPPPVFQAAAASRSRSVQRLVGLFRQWSPRSRMLLEVRWHCATRMVIVQPCVAPRS